MKMNSTQMRPDRLFLKSNGEFPPLTANFRVVLLRRIPKGFRLKAQQRCWVGQSGSDRATLGGQQGINSTLKGLWPARSTESVCALKATTLSGLETRTGCAPRVARCSQPWAGGHNPF